MNEINKKQKRLFIIGLLTIMVMIIGATYAYFQVATTNNFGESTIISNVNNLGTVALVGTNANLSLNLTAPDMMKENAHHYYATSDGTPSVLPNTIEVGHTSVVGNGNFTCTYELSVTQSGDLYSAFQNMATKSAGQIQLKVGNKTYDFNTANLFPITVTGTLTDVRSDNVKKINTSFKIVNKADVNQTTLAGKTIEINIETTSFSCIAKQEKNYNNYLRTSDINNSALLYNIADSNITKADFESIEFLATTDVPNDGTVDPWDISYQANNSIMASYTDTDEDGLYELYIGQNGGVVANTDSANYLFKDFTNVEEINLEQLDTSRATYMYYMFYNCNSLTTLDISNFDTSKVTDMNNMFYGCSSLTTLDVGNFDTSRVQNMQNMFHSCSNLSALDVSNFDTSNVLFMQGMFYGCSSLTALDVSNFDTSRVQNMAGMFESCTGLTILDVSNFDTSSVLYMNRMFYNCSSLTSIDVGNFDTSSVTGMQGMFYGCIGLTTLDLSAFDTSSVTTMNSMFSGCSNLTTIYVSDKFITTGLTGLYSNELIFYNCSSLVGGNGTSVATKQVYDNTYAKIDKVGQEGYFTER